MNMGRVFAIAGRIVTQFRRDKRTLGLIVLVPLLVMALMGYLISDDKEPIKAAFIQLDQGMESPLGRISLGDQLYRELGKQKGLTLVTYHTVAEAEKDVRHGKIQGAILIPAGLTNHLLSQQGGELSLIVKGTDQGTERIIQMSLAKALPVLARNKPGGAAGQSQIGIKITALLVKKSLTNIDYYAPVLIVGFAFFLIFLLTSISFLRERSSGTMERLSASPVTRVEVMLGYLLGFLVFALIQTLVVLGYAVWVLHAEVAGSILLVLAVLTLMVIGVVNLGITLSFLARNELQVIQFIPIIIVPQIFLGGLIWPLETLHPAFRYLAQFFPITHAVAALREIMLGGAGFADIQGRFYALLAFAVLMILFGAGTLRKQQG